MNEHDPTEILSALIDGETVSPEELTAALSRPGAADMLVDFASFRLALREDETGSRSEEESAPSVPPAEGRLGPARRLAALAAAAALIVATAATTRWLGSGDSQPAPIVIEAEAAPLAIPSERLKVVPSGSRGPGAGNQEKKEEWL